jgi:hypothetical protein
MTAATTKTLQMYLPTGDSCGLRADITTRLVLAMLPPRSELAAGKMRQELNHQSVYFLFGEDKESAKQIVYIRSVGPETNTLRFR